MIAILLLILWALSLFLAIYSYYEYIINPLTELGLNTYEGAKYLVLFIVLTIVFYFKNPL